MAAKSDYVSGTITLTNGDAAFTGTATGWLLAGFKEGDTIIDITGATEFMGVVATIDANGSGTLTKEWEGPTLTDVAYRMRYQPDGARVSAQARNLIELLGNGNVLALAGLSGSANQVPMFTGPGAMTLVPKTDLVSGVAYDVLVDLLADRAAYDGQAEGFIVLVADVGDGRSAVYAKASASSGDWSAPAYVTGPVGPLPDVTVGTVTTGAPGSSVIVTPTPTVGGVELDFTIPAGRGPVTQGDYNPVTAYVLDDAVLDNGSTWIALGPTTGNAPPVLPTTSNAWWQLQARKGTDGSGTGDVVGPAGSTADRLAVFDGTTGKLLKDGGKTIAELLPAGYDDLLTTVSLLALQVADNTNVALFLGSSGNRVADSFDALTYVDVAGATNLDTSAAGILKPALASTATLANLALNGDSSDWSGFNVRFFTSSASLTTNGTKVRLRLRGAAGGTATVSGMTIGHRAGSGDAWDMAATPVPVTVGGLSSFVIAAGANVLTDWVDFALNKTVDFLVAAHLSTTSLLRRRTGLGSQHDVYYKSASSEVGTANVTGYSTLAGTMDFVEEIIVSAGVANETVRSAAFTAATVPTKMKALIRVKEVDAATAGTDYTLECSRDGGASWAAMALTYLFTSPSPTASIRVVEAAETSVTGQPSGTSPRWRFKTINNKNVELHDVYFYWS